MTEPPKAPPFIRARASLAAAMFVALGMGAAQAQGTTGVPGSPSATTTIPGTQLPPPPPPFRGGTNAMPRS